MDDIVDCDPRGEDERDGEGGAVLPPGLPDSEYFHRTQSEHHLLALLAATWTGGVVVWDPPGHQEELEMR